MHKWEVGISLQCPKLWVVVLVVRFEGGPLLASMKLPLFPLVVDG